MPPTRRYRMYVVTVESTTLATVAYDEARALLQLAYCTRELYLYFGVLVAVLQAMLNAQS